MGINVRYTVDLFVDDRRDAESEEQVTRPSNSSIFGARRRDKAETAFLPQVKPDSSASHFIFSSGTFQAPFSTARSSPSFHFNLVLSQNDSCSMLDSRPIGRWDQLEIASSVLLISLSRLGAGRLRRSNISRSALINSSGCRKLITLNIEYLLFPFMKSSRGTISFLLDKSQLAKVAVVWSCFFKIKPHELPTVEG